MLQRIQRWSSRFIRKSTQVAQTPLNRVSLVILIIIDIFVLINVFSGLYSINAFPLSPAEEYPCYSDYQVFHNSQQTLEDRQFAAIDTVLNQPDRDPTVFRDRRLGAVAPLCQTYLQQQRALQTAENRQIKLSISDRQTRITDRQNDIRELQQQYDSTLLEKIAEQDPRASINTSTAEQTRADIEQAQADIDRWNEEIRNLKQDLISSPLAQVYLQTLSDRETYQTLEDRYQKAQFWYPNLQFILQLLFLAPLIAATYFWHQQSVQRDRGLQALLSWHLLLIFCIPLVVRIFQFLQFSNLVALAVDAVVFLVGGLRFVASYLFILVVPLLGFGLIKVLQHFIFNPQVQAKKRIQKQRCIQCNARLQTGDLFCPHCGFHQYQECHHCQQWSYRYAPFCRSCGSTFSETE